MKKLILRPNQWSCDLDNCDIGFFVYNEELCIKTNDLDPAGKNIVYNCRGDQFPFKHCIVQPVIFEWTKE